MKLFNKEDVYSWSNCNELRLATEGYVGNSLSDLTCNIAPEGKVVLLSIDKNSALCFNVENRQDNLAKVYHFAFFLPADKVKEVKEEEKKYRPFTLDEFNKVIPMGTVFKYRYKTNDAKDVYSVYYHANLDCENGFQSIFFENRYYSFEFCFNELKLFLNGKWQPFGVEE